MDDNSRTIAEVKTAGLCVMRDQVVGLLLGIADKLGVPIHWEHKLTDLDLVGTGHVCAFESCSDGVARDRKTVRVGRALVAADGNYSNIRRKCVDQLGLGVTTKDWGLKMRYINAPAPPKGHALPPVIDGRSNYIIGSDGYVAQQPDGQWSVMLGVTDDSPAWMRSRDPSPENIRHLRALCERIMSPVAEHLLTTDEIYATYFTTPEFAGAIVRCNTLAPTDWVALVGDAAHAVAPYSGEGINSSLESASILALLLAAGKSCADYDAVRRPEAHALFQWALRIGRIVNNKGAELFASTFCTVALSIAQKLGLVAYTATDFTLGAKAAEHDIVPYTGILSMDVHQKDRCLHPCSIACFYMCCCCCGRCD